MARRRRHIWIEYHHTKRRWRTEEQLNWEISRKTFWRENNGAAGKRAHHIQLQAVNSWINQSCSGIPFGKVAYFATNMHLERKVLIGIPPELRIICIDSTKVNYLRMWMCVASHGRWCCWWHYPIIEKPFSVAITLLFFCGWWPGTADQTIYRRGRRSTPFYGVKRLCAPICSKSDTF